MTHSVPSLEPSPILTLTTKKSIFLDDTTQTKPITIDHTHVADLKMNDYLSTLLINYLVQRSVNIKEEQRTGIETHPGWVFTLMNTFLQKHWHHTASHQTRFDMLQNKYQYFSFGKFRFFCLVCSNNHYYLIHMNFYATDPNKHIFMDVKVYDSLEYATEERVSTKVPFMPTTC
jgi:hypothetical protein